MSSTGEKQQPSCRQQLPQQTGKLGWMASSSSLFIGTDESTKSTKRSFVEIEFGGQLCSRDPDLHIWCVPLTVKEVVSEFHRKDA